MNGKQKCRILKEIRQQIARENDIRLVTEECAHRGECRGTCPRCEAEVAYLERELEKRRTLKKRVALAGISAGVTLALAGCSVIEAVVDAVSAHRDGGEEIEQLDGEIAPYDIQTLDGMVAPMDGDEAVGGGD